MQTMISEKNIQFLENLGDTDVGYIARAEYAEMTGVPVEVIDSFILDRIYAEGK